MIVATSLLFEVTTATAAAPRAGEAARPDAEGSGDETEVVAVDDGWGSCQCCSDNSEEVGRRLVMDAKVLEAIVRLVPGVMIVP